MIKTVLLSQNFHEGLIANLVADMIVGLIIGLIITRYLDSREKKNEKDGLEIQRKEKLKMAVNMLWSEIEYNRSQLKLMIDSLPKTNLVYPALETSTWDIIDRPLIIDSLKPNDVANILHIYNRIKTINNMYYSMLNRVNWIEEGKKPIIKKMFMDAVVDRCKELKTYIDEVIPENLFKEINSKNRARKK